MCYCVYAYVGVSLCACVCVLLYGLEILSVLSRQLQSSEVPGKDMAIAALQQDIQRAFGGMDMCDVVQVDIPDNWGEVDDYWGTFEWSGGGMIHIHVAFWISGSPRIDKVVCADGTSKEEGDEPGTGRSEIVWTDDGDVSLQDDSAARALTSFSNAFIRSGIS